MDLEGMKRRELQALCKRHGLPAGGTNAGLVARLDAALSGVTGAEEEEEVSGVVARKGCLKQPGGDAANVKKVTFAAVEEGNARRLRSRVIWSPIAAKPRGKCAQATSDSAAAEDSVSAEPGRNVPLRRSRRNSVSAAEAEEVGEVVAVDRKRNRKDQNNGEVVAVSAQLGVSCRVTRRSSLAAAAVLLPPAVEKKRGRRKATGGSNELVAEAPDMQNSAQVGVSCRVTRRSSLAGAAVLLPAAVEKKRGRGKAACVSNELVAEVPDVQNSAQVGVSCRVTRRSSLAGAAVLLPAAVEKKRGRGKTACGSNKLVAEAPDVQNSAQVEIAARITRSRATAPIAVTPTVVESKRRRKTMDASMVEETHTASQLENEMQSSRPLTRRHQQVSSSKEDKNHEQIAAPNRAPLLRRSGRNHSEDAEKQPIVEKSVKRPTRKSVVLAKQPATKEPARKSRRKSVVSYLHEKEKGLIAEKNMEARQGRSNSTTSKERSSKRRRAAIPEEAICVKEANDDIIINDATKDAHKATHEYNKESSSKVQEICQVNDTREEFYSGQLNVKVALTDEICTAQNVPVVIPGSEYGDNANESSDKSKQPQEHCDNQAVDNHLPETRSEHGENANESSDKSEQPQEQCDNQALMSEGDVNMGDVLSIDSTVGYHQDQCPVSGEGRVGWKANASEPGEKNLANVMSTGLHFKNLHHDIDITAEEADKDVLPMASPIEEHGEKYTMSHVAVEKSVGWEPSACESAENPLTGIFSDDLHTMHLQHDGDLLNKEIGEASGTAPPISESDTNPEIQCNADESIPCPSLGSKGNLCMTSLHLEGAADDCIIPVVNADKGFSSDGRPSSFGLELMFAEKESYSKNIENTAVEIVGGDKPNASGSVCLGDEDVQPSPYSLDDIVEGISNNDDSMQTSQQDNGMEVDDIVEGISKNDDSMQTSQQDNGMEGLPENKFDEEQLLPVLSLDAKHTKEVINFEEVACEDDESKKLVLSEELKASSEKTNVNGPDGNAYGITDAVLSSALRTPANDNYETCLGSNTDVLHQGHHDQCWDDAEDTIEDASAKDMERGIVLLSGKEKSNLKDGQLNSKLEGTKVVDSGLYFNKDIGNILDRSVAGEITPSGFGLSKDSSKVFRQEVLDGSSMEKSLDGSSTCGEKIVCRVDAIENPLISSVTTGYKHECALSEESSHSLKNYAGTCSSNPRELLMDLQSLFSEGNIKESNPHDGLAFPSAENSGDESINVEQQIKVHHGSDLSHLGSSLQGTIFREKIDSAVAGIGSPSSSLATPDYKYDGSLSKEAVCGMKTYTGTPSVDPKHLIMELQSLHSEGSTEKPDLQDNLSFPSAEKPVVWHVEEVLGTHVSSEPDTYQRPCEDLSRHEEKGSCMKGSLTSDQIDLADDAYLIERDIVDPMEVLSEEKVERKCMPTADSDILQDSNGHGICQYSSQKHIVEANSRLSSCGSGTEVFHQDHKEERSEHNEGKLSPKAFAENNISEDAPVAGVESLIMLPLVVGMSEIPDAQLNTMASGESEELSFSCDKDTIENFCTGPAKGDVNSSPKDLHIDTCQKQEVPEVLSLTKSPEESAKFQCVSVSGSGRCQQRVNDRTSMQATYNIETVNQGHEDYNQNNEDRTTPGVSSSRVPEAVEIEIEQSEMEIGLILATETSVLAVRDEQPNSKLEGNGDQITLGILASSVREAVEIEPSEMEIWLIPAAETSVLPVPDEQYKSKLQDNEVDEHSCSYDKDFFILSDSEPLKREASSLHKDDCMDLSSEDNHPNDRPAPRSPEPSAYFQNDNDLGSVGIGNPSVLLDYKLEVRSEEAACKMKKYTGTHSDPRHLPMELVSPYSEGSEGICQSRSQKPIVEEANFRLSSGGTFTKVFHQDLKEECKKHNEGKFTPKALVENNMSEDAPVEGMESSIMLPLVAGTSEIPDEQLNIMMSDENEELSFSCDKDTIENICTGPAKGDLNSLPKEFHIDTCQKQEAPEVLSLPKSPEESAKFQCVSGSGHCQQRVNKSTGMQVTYDINETVNQDHEEYNQNNEAVEMETEQTEMEIGLIPATETSVLAVPDEQPNSKLEGNGDQITLGIPASCVLKAAEIEQSETEIGLIPAAEISVLPVPDEQSNSKLEGNEVDEHNCSYDKEFFILSDSESLKREASSLHKDDCMDLCREDNYPIDLPAPRSPEPSAYFQNDNDSGSVGICQSSRRGGISELRAKLQSFKLSSAVKGSYIAMSAPRLKPGDSMSQSAIAALRNIENPAAVKSGHPVKPNTDGKDASRRALQPISGRPREQ